MGILFPTRHEPQARSLLLLFNGCNTFCISITITSLFPHTYTASFLTNKMGRFRSSLYARRVSQLSNQFDQVPDWSKQNAPVENQQLQVKHVLWVPVLILVAYASIQALNDFRIAVAWAYLIYETYIIFDHLPFMFTNDLYTSARVNYQNLSLSLFWGMEAIASVVASQSVVNAPSMILLANVPNHVFFMGSNYISGVATSKAFLWEKKHENLWLVGGVTMDTTIHAISLWYYIQYIAVASRKGSPLEETSLLMTTGATTWILWGVVMSVSILSTCWFHAPYMSWEHFALYVGHRPKRYAQRPMRISQTYPRGLQVQ